MAHFPYATRSILFVELRATDNDEGRNSAVKYKTMYEPDAELFHINPVSGLVTAKVSFNYEQQMYYEVGHIGSTKS